MGALPAVGRGEAGRGRRSRWQMYARAMAARVRRFGMTVTAASLAAAPGCSGGRRRPQGRCGLLSQPPVLREAAGSRQDAHAMRAAGLHAGGCALPVQSSRAHRRHSGSWSAGPTTLHQNFSVHPAALNASVMPSPPHGSRMLPGYSPEPVRHQIALPISVRRNPAHQLRPWGWQHPNHLDHAQLGYST